MPRLRSPWALLALPLLGFAWACSGSPAVERPSWSEAQLDLLGSLSPLPQLPPSPSNRFADDEAAALLGQKIFFDTRFSIDGSIGCVTCHKPALYFADAQPLAVGITQLARHTPTLIGSQWSPFQFWDGRKDSLWSQALGPFEVQGELGSSRLQVAHRIFERYSDEYTAIFGALPALDRSERFPDHGMPMPDEPEHAWARAWEAMDAADRYAVNEVFANVGKAIEAYERQLTPRKAPFDDYVAALAAGDASGGGHLSLAAERGLAAFIGPAGCINCHNGPLFSDYSFHNVGLAPTPNLEKPDLGRAVGSKLLLADPFNSAGEFSDSTQTHPRGLDDLAYLNPEFEDMLGAFKTPTLRNIEFTAPYGHNGQFGELDQVLEWYGELPLVPLTGHRDLILRVLPAEVSKSDLVAFLETLGGELPDERWLRAPPE